MVDFLLQIVVPLILAGILITVVFSVVRAVLDVFHLNFYLFKLAGFFVVYYFVGEYAYNFLIQNVSENPYSLVKFIYMPVQVIMNFFA